jgi:DNA-binding MarR family transcriptional regulator
MPIHSNAHAIAQGLLKVRKARHDYLPEMAISEAGWAVLLALFSVDSDAGSCAERRLAGIADLSRTTTLRWVQRLEEAGLVTRTFSPTDKRIVRVHLTERGRDAMESCFDAAAWSSRRSAAETSERLTA